MKERNLILVRHGQSEWNAKNLFTGWENPGLTDKGLDISDFESQLRQILKSRMEKREEYKQKQLPHYTNTSKFN